MPTLPGQALAPTPLGPETRAEALGALPHALPGRPEPLPFGPRKAPARERPLPDPTAVRLCVIPDSAPPYDDEMRTGSQPAGWSFTQAPPEVRTPGSPDRATHAPLASPMASAGPDGHNEAADQQASPAGADGEPQRTDSDDGAPPPGKAGHGSAAAPGWPSQFAQVLAETLAGARPPRQIVPWTTERARTHIRRLGPLLSLERQPRVRRIITSRPSTGIVEMTVVVGSGGRTRGIAVRFEHSESQPAVPGRPARGARWLCTAVEAA
jgi:hypothetical protein